MWSAFVNYCSLEFVLPGRTILNRLAITSALTDLAFSLADEHEFLFGTLTQLTHALEKHLHDFISLCNCCLMQQADKQCKSLRWCEIPHIRGVLSTCLCCKLGHLRMRN